MKCFEGFILADNKKAPGRQVPRGWLSTSVNAVRSRKIQAVDKVIQNVLCMNQRNAGMI